jgi:hypothetical protein
LDSLGVDVSVRVLRIFLYLLRVDGADVVVGGATRSVGCDTDVVVMVGG